MSGVNSVSAVLGVLSEEPASVNEIRRRLRKYGVILTYCRVYDIAVFWAESGCAGVERLRSPGIGGARVRFSLTRAGEDELDRHPPLVEVFADYEAGVLAGLSLMTHQTTYAEIWAVLVSAPEGLPAQMIGHRSSTQYVGPALRHMVRQGLVEATSDEPPIYRALSRKNHPALKISEVA